MKPLPAPRIVTIASPSIGQPQLAIATPIDLASQRIAEFFAAKSFAANTQSAYGRDIQIFLAWNQTGLIVSRRQFANFKRFLETPKKNGGQGLKAASTNRVLSSIKSLYSWMIRSGYIEEDPTTAIDLLTLPAPEAQDLSESDVQCIFQAVRGSRSVERDEALLWVLLHGLRSSEAIALDWEDFDGERLHIHKAKDDSKGCVPLLKEATNILNEYGDWWKAMMGLDRLSGPMFISRSARTRGKRLTYSGLREILNLIKSTTEIDLHAHRFRHTYATQLLKLGIDPHHAMNLTRHISRTSFHRYTVAVEQQAAEAAFRKATAQIKEKVVDRTDDRHQD